MIQKIKAGAVSYLNTKPLIYGFEQGKMKDEVELLIDNPANIAKLLLNDEIDVGLVPVAIIPFLKEYYIISDYGIACEGAVASVCLFSDVPLVDIKTILLDYQSRTSVALLKVLLKEHWQISPELVAGSEDFENRIEGSVAGLVIGDRALLQRGKHKYIYDLGLAWKELTGLPFVFAAWVSNKVLPQSFCDAFNEATATGLAHIPEIVAKNHFAAFDLEDYYNNCIKFRIDLPMHEALTLFFDETKQRCMKVVIFAGGLGTRISEETDARPKPMVEIGGKPILWHIMKIYNSYGFNDFVICLGYKGYVIKEYFMNYFLHNSDLTIDLENNDVQFHSSKSEKFKVTLIETGLNTKTAGRLKAVQSYLGNEDFMLTYGDGVCDVNLSDLLAYHKQHGKIATVTAVALDARFGGMDLAKDGAVVSFKEKAKDESKWINGGFFILKPEVFKYLEGDMSNMMWEDEPLEKLTNDDQLQAYQHKGFWKPMDALRDKIELENLWQTGQAKWKTW